MRFKRGELSDVEAREKLEKAFGKVPMIFYSDGIIEVELTPEQFNEAMK